VLILEEVYWFPVENDRREASSRFHQQTLAV
jgi:hypothetical protein